MVIVLFLEAAQEEVEESVQTVEMLKKIQKGKGVDVSRPGDNCISPEM